MNLHVNGKDVVVNVEGDIVLAVAKVIYKRMKKEIRRRPLSFESFT